MSRWVVPVLVLLLGGCIQIQVGEPTASDPVSTPATAATPGAPRLSFTTDPASPKAGQVVLFTLRATGLSAGDQVSSASWRFGDGGTATDRHPAHTFTDSGAFAVSVAVTTARGANATHQATVRVQGEPASTGGPEPAPTSGPEPAPVADNSTAGNESHEPEPFEPTEPSGTCGSLDSLTPVAPDPLLSAGLATGWPLLELDVALLADPAFVDTHPGDWQRLLAELVADASGYYEDQVGLRLNASLIDRLPDGSLQPGRDDGKQRAVARGYMQANHANANVDAVAVILGADYEGSVAGQVECVHGAAYPDYAYLWAEYDQERAGPGGIGIFEDIPLKVFMHELAHLLAAHHHYSTCGHPYANARTSDLTGVCDVMINDIGLASFYFGPTNRLVMRSFVEEIGIGEPV